MTPKVVAPFRKSSYSQAEGACIEVAVRSGTDARYGTARTPQDRSCTSTVRSGAPSCWGRRTESSTTSPRASGAGQQRTHMQGEAPLSADIRQGRFCVPTPDFRNSMTLSERPRSRDFTPPRTPARATPRDARKRKRPPRCSTRTGGSDRRSGCGSDVVSCPPSGAWRSRPGARRWAVVATSLLAMLSRR